MSVPPLGPVAPQLTATVPITGTKRLQPAHPEEVPGKKKSKWSPEEDALVIQLRGSGMKWEDISEQLERSATSCRLHYQNYLERRSEWDEDKKNKFARLYERSKAEMWLMVAEKMGVPWRAAEAMHWQLGQHDMARRAGVVPFMPLWSATNQSSIQSSPNPTTDQSFICPRKSYSPQLPFVQEKQLQQSVGGMVYQADVVPFSYPTTNQSLTGSGQRLPSLRELQLLGS